MSRSLAFLLLGFAIAFVGCKRSRNTGSEGAAKPAPAVDAMVGTVKAGDIDREYQEPGVNKAKVAEKYYGKRFYIDFTECNAIVLPDHMEHLGEYPSYRVHYYFRDNKQLPNFNYKTSKVHGRVKDHKTWEDCVIEN